MKYIPEIFSTVNTYSNEQNPCSPENPGITWRGILLNAPKEIILSPLEDSIVIPICGFYQLDLSKMQQSEALKFVVTIAEPKGSFSGFMIDSDPNHDAPNPDEKPIDPKDLVGMSTSTYFNLNLLTYVKFPTIAGEYRVFADYAGSRSNILNFKISINN